MRLALVGLLFACSSPAPRPTGPPPGPPPILLPQPNGFVPVAVVMDNGRRPPPPATCSACPSGECDIRFTGWCGATKDDKRDWWVCAPKRDELRADGCPARMPSPESTCTAAQRCTYSRCPGAAIGFDDFATCDAGVWHIMSED